MPSAATRAASRERLDLHQRDQAVNLGSFGDSSANPAEPERVVRQAGPGRLRAAARRGVAFVEDAVDDFEHTGKPQARELVGARHLERHAGIGERLLRANQSYVQSLLKSINEFELRQQFGGFFAYVVGIASVSSIVTAIVQAKQLQPASEFFLGLI